MYRFFSYIRFWLSAKNQHGVHSPFVYDFVTKGLYKKSEKNLIFDDFIPKDLSKKEKKILQKIVDYFDVDGFYTNQNQIYQTEKNKYNIVFFNTIDDFYMSKVDSKIIIIKGIHRYKSTLKQWQRLIAAKNDIVTVDLFYFGLIFYRTEQAKEHFKIRV